MITQLKRYGIFLILLPLIAGADPAADGLKNESELGYVLTNGNTDVETFNVKQKNIYTFSQNSFTFTGSFLTSKTDDTTNAKNWTLGLRYERALSDRWSIFLGQSALGDRFQNVRQRYNTDIGAKYFLIKEEKFTWFGELGYRYTRENSAAGHRTFHSARLYTEAEKKWNETVSTKYWLEYLPNFSDSEDYLINSELSMNAMLTSIFSVKTGYLVRFDGQPAPGVAKKTDSVFTTALVAKF